MAQYIPPINKRVQQTLERFTHRSGAMMRHVAIAVALALEDQQRERLRHLKQQARKPLGSD